MNLKLPSSRPVYGVVSSGHVAPVESELSQQLGRRIGAINAEGLRIENFVGESARPGELAAIVSD